MADMSAHDLSSTVVLYRIDVTRRPTPCLRSSSLDPRNSPCTQWNILVNPILATHFRERHPLRWTWFVLQMHTFTGQKFVSMDTLFSLVDAVLYAHLIEMKDNNPDLLNDKVIQVDVRSTVLLIKL